ncbi:MAG TPA: secondary thiamine-phosphate synthase enzyme YjbQ [Candidatus Dormibacteraeota bacterium]|nr:secondary thiamine-phosphate synthase enzyme YjbQ [Candidatus Dormibacteraeota bacterium]
MAATPDIITIRTRERADALDITERVAALVARSGVEDGICQVYVPHTTAGVFINENADPDALRDLLFTLDRLVPWEQGYRHAEGNAAAHIKSVLTGNSQMIPVRSGRLALGRWQGIFLVDFDGPRERQARITVLKM